MRFEENKDLSSQEATKCLVQVCSTEGAYSRLPSNTTALSRFYHISSSKNLNTAVTLKIFHQAAEDDIHQLRFLTSTDNSPPYNYRILCGGHFTSAYGEITVERFSLYTICKLYAYHGVKGVLSYMEIHYEARLYRSIQPTLLDSEYSWNLYLSVVKKCDIFSHCMKKYIQEEFEDKLKMISSHVVIFDDDCDCITVRHGLKTNSPQNVFLEEVDHDNTLCHEHISDHVDGCPPLLVYNIHGKPNCSLELKFTLDGLQEAKQFTMRQSQFPELRPAAPQRSISRSSASSQSEDISSSATSEPTPVCEQAPKGKEYPFTLKYLTLLEADPPLRLIETMSSKWEMAADLLDMSIGRINIIREDNCRRSVENCCRSVMDHWLYDIHHKYSYPRSWEGMCQLLRDMNLTRLANNVQEVIAKKSSAHHKTEC